MKRRLLLSFLLLGMLFIPFSLQADVIKGKVIDAKDGRVLPNVDLAFIKTTNYGRTMTTLTTDSTGHFTFSNTMTGMVTFTASYIGYKTYRKAMYLYSQQESQDTVDIGEVRLEPSTVMLEAVKVTGHLPRITMSGDTIVFNPEAFKLEDNARLLELLRKLPGVQQHDDGRFYWNGKPIRLLMDGKDIFCGGAILSQLPAEVAKKLKLYDRKSKLAKHTGKDDGKEDQVLDIQIKPGFLDKWYGDIEGDYTDENHYKGELRAYKLSDKDPLMVYGDANNMNQYHIIGQESYQSGIIDHYGKEQYGSLAWQHNGQTKGADDINYVSVNPDFGHQDGSGSTKSSTQQFFPGEQQTFTLSKTDNGSHAILPGFRINTQLYTDSVNYLTFSLDSKYTKKRTWVESRLARFKDSPYTFGESPLDAVFDDDNNSQILRSGLLLLRNRNRSTAISEGGNVDAEFDLTHYLARQKGELDVVATVNYLDNNTRTHTNRQYDFLTTAQNDALNQFGRNPNSKTGATIAGTLKYYLSKAVLLNITDKIGYDFNRNDLDFFTDNNANVADGYTPTTQDAANTQRSRLHTWTNTVTVSPVFNFNKRMHLTLALDWAYSHDRLNFRRGSLDTLAVRNTNLLTPSLTFLWKMNRAQSMNIKFGYTSSKPEMLSTIGYEDSTDPLSVIHGNTALRNYGKYNGTFNFNQVIARLQMVTSLSLEFNHDVRPLSSLWTYNGSTSSYSYMPVNVKGGNMFKAGLNIDKSFGPFFRLTNNGSLTWQKLYAYLTRTSLAETPQLNGEKYFSFNDDLSLSYETDPFTATAYGKVNAYRYRYDRSSEFNSDPLLLTYGLRLTINQKHWFARNDISDVYRHGYLSSDVNRHRVIWNAMIGIKLLKNQAGLALTAQDILKKFNFIESNVSAYSRSESWSKYFYHYIGIVFQYNFEPKKRQ